MLLGNLDRTFPVSRDEPKAIGEACRSFISVLPSVRLKRRAADEATVTAVNVWASAALTGDDMQTNADLRDERPSSCWSYTALLTLGTPFHPSVRRKRGGKTAWCH